VTSNLTPERATERAFERAWVIWQLFAYRRRGRRTDPGPAIPSADRAAGILPLAKVRWRRAARWRRLARRGAGRAIMAEVLQCHVFARPDFAMGGPHGGAPRGPIAGGLHGGTAFRDGWTAWRRRASRNPAAPRNAVSPWEAGAPRSAASRWEAAANPWLGAIARCSRTGSSNPSPSSGESANPRSPLRSKGQQSRSEDATSLCARKGPADDSRLWETTAIEPTRPCGADKD
jgi:hypothetical protein